MSTFLQRIFDLKKNGGPADIVSDAKTFLSGHSVLRTLVMILVGGLIVFRLNAFSQEILDRLRALDDMTMAYCLMFLDMFLIVGLLSALLFLLALFFGYPTKGNFRFHFLREHPVWTFISITVPTAALFILIPAYFLKYVYEISLYSTTGLLAWMPPKIYIAASITTAITLGLSAADVASKKRSLHLWTLLFLFWPNSFANRFPMLWWNAGAPWFSGISWKLLRPVLACATCFFPLLVLPSSQFVEKDLSALQRGQTESIRNLQQPCAGYFMQWVPDKPVFYMRCDQYLYKVNMENGTPVADRYFDGNFRFDEATIDFERSKAIIYAPHKKKLFQIKIPDMKILSAEPLPYADFQFAPEGIKQLYDPKKRRLFIAEPWGDVLAMNLDETAEQKSYVHTKIGTPIVAFEYDVKYNRIFALERFTLQILDSQNLSITYEAVLDSPGFAIAFDYKKNLYFISFPMLMEVWAFDLQSHKVIKKIPAPVGVRTLAVDRGNRLLFFGSMAGIIEVRDLETFHLKSRARVSPWIHWMDASSSEKKLLVSVNENPPFVYVYDKFHITEHPLDLLQRIAEMILRVLLILERQIPVIVVLGILFLAGAAFNKKRKKEQE